MIQEEYEKQLIVRQFYWDKTRFDEPEVVMVAKWGEAVLECINHSFSQLDTVFLKDAETHTMPLIHYIKALLFKYVKNQGDSAYVYLLAEYRNSISKHFLPLIYEIIEEANKRNEHALCAKIIVDNPEIINRVSNSIDIHKIMFYGAPLVHYLKFKIRSAYAYVTISGIFFAILIFFIWFYYLYNLDFYQKEKKYTIALTIFWGFCTSELALPIYDIYLYVLDFKLKHNLLNNLMYCIFGIGLIEESVKILPLIFLMLFTKEPDDTYDYLFYASISALSFATSENLMFFGEDRQAGYSARTMYAVVMHITCSSLASYGWLLASKTKDTWLSIKYIGTYLFIACILHGLYDFFLFYNLSLLFYVGFLAAVMVWIIMLNNALNNSKHFSYSIFLKSYQLRMFIGIALIVLFILEYIYYGWKNGKQAANNFFVSNSVGFALLTFFFTSKLSQFDLIRGYWRKIAWQSENESYTKDSFHEFWKWPQKIVNFIVNFFEQNSIKPQNYVGFQLRIYFSVDQNSYGPGWIEITVVDRLVVHKLCNDKSKEIPDPNWFVGFIVKQSLDIAFRQFYIFKTKNKNNDLEINERAFVEVSVPVSDAILTKTKIYHHDLLFYSYGLATKVKKPG
jgi:RsiW-degrading membrane proteinase PrsW (M82 family)